jgi:hypothetical protein
MKFLTDHYAKLIPVTVTALVAWIAAATDGQMQLDGESLIALVSSIAASITWRVPQRPLP